MFMVDSLCCRCVSIHASSREDATQELLALIVLFLVSIHASSREDATFLKCGIINTTKCFNPRVLAGGRDS